MAEPKTQKTKASVVQFIAAVEDNTRRKDAKAIDKMFREISGEKPAMWGTAIIGYGQWSNTNTLGTAPWPKIAFSPRKANLVLYVLSESKECAALLKKLGKHKTGKSCLYINKLADVDAGVLRDLVAQSWKEMTKKYG
ncbi:MAG: DUF1801 domain-containing protein [Caulobacterales bacterium]|jgi:hypothetical protein|nr:DUF1801 domain-containing protein [Caulobacterales bacterium]